MTNSSETKMKESNKVFKEIKTALQAFQQKRLNQTYPDLKQIAEWQDIPINGLGRNDGN